MNRGRDADFVQFLESMVNLDALDRMTMELDDELQDSQVVMNEIKGMIDSLPAKVENMKSEPKTNGLRHQDISNFLSASPPKLLMPDMEDMVHEVDLDDVIAQMKTYTEDLKKNFTLTELKAKDTTAPKQLENKDLEQYASSLDQFCKRINNLKLNKNADENNRNSELETKLTLLCDDVNMFTKMVDAKTSLSEANKNWSATQLKTLDYDNLINKLLSDINEVSYLLISKH